MAEIKALAAGYKKFYERYFASGDDTYRELAETGQAPKTLIVACSDSRVDPSIITDAGPGDIFVIRNVANVVPPYEKDGGLHGVSAALEFAVKILGVKHIVVLGHSRCAGVDALLDGNAEERTDFIGAWVAAALPAKEKALAEIRGDDHDRRALRRRCAQENVLLSLARLRTFPWIDERVASGALRLHGWYFSLRTGALSEYKPDVESFVDLPTA
ncbi:MAG: carbonic anhydrase [Rickettsiales bacterium]